MNKRIRKKKADQIKKNRLLTQEQTARSISKRLKTKKGYRDLKRAMRESKRRSLEMVWA